MKTVSATNAADGKKAHEGDSSFNTRINTGIRDSTVSQNVQCSGWILLELPLPLQHTSGLLGSSVTDPTAPLDDYLPNISITSSLKVQRPLVMRISFYKNKNFLLNL